MNAPAKNPKWVLFRVTVACVVGLVVGGLALRAAYQAAQTNDIRLRWTQSALKSITFALDDYRQKKGSFPRSLDQLKDAPGVSITEGHILDSWGHPFVYTVHGTHYLVVSYGRDGKPGGIGVDRDISTDNPDPPGPAMTFQQFLSMREDIGMIETSLVSGIYAGILSLRIVRPIEPTRRNIAIFAVKMIVTLAATVVVAIIITVLHLPTGH